MRTFRKMVKMMAVAVAVAIAVVLSALFCACNVSGGSSYESSAPAANVAAVSKSSGIGSIVIDNVKVMTVSENDMLTVEYGKVGSYNPVDSLEITGTKADSFTHFYAEFSGVDAGTYWVKCIYNDGKREAAVSSTTVDVKGSEVSYVSDITIEPGVFDSGSPILISGVKYFGITVETEGNVKEIAPGQELTISCSANPGSMEVGFCEWYINGKKVASGNSFSFSKNATGYYTVMCIATDNATKPLHADSAQVVIRVK